MLYCYATGVNHQNKRTGGGVSETTRWQNQFDGCPWQGAGDSIKIQQLAKQDTLDYSKCRVITTSEQTADVFQLTSNKVNVSTGYLRAETNPDKYI